jgi:hypothetical protein
METVWKLIQKLKISLPYDLAIPFLDTYLKVLQNTIEPLEHPCLFTIAKLWKQSRCPTHN